MAIFTEAYCMQLMHESSQDVISELLEGDNSFMNFELSPCEVQRICQECKNHNLSISESYLSAILDLYDRRIVSYVIRDSNNNALVFDTFDKAIESNPNAHPLCHSDRGYQYTSRTFHAKLEAA